MQMVQLESKEDRDSYRDQARKCKKQYRWKKRGYNVIKLTEIENNYKKGRVQECIN